MTILPTHTASRIRNRSMGILHLIAADESCEVSDILALLPFPSQPAPAVVQAEEVPPVASSADHSDACPHDPDGQHFIGCGCDDIEDEPQPSSTPAVQVHDIGLSSKGSDVTSHSLPGAERAADLANDTGKSGGASASPAPVKSKRARFREMVVANPAITAKEAAAAFDVSDRAIRAIASQCGYRFPKASGEQDTKKAETTEKLRTSVRKEKPKPELEKASSRKTIVQQVREVHEQHPDWNSRQISVAIPGSNPQTVSVALSDIRAEERAAADIVTANRLMAEAREREAGRSLPDGPRRTLKDRVRAMHLQHPRLTAVLIAKELGANPSSVSTILAQIRGEAPKAEADKPEFAGKAALQDHYAQVGKRLGRPA